jgi:hypothetical protein
MASLEIAAKANPALVLPSVLIALQLEHTGLVPAIKRIYQDEETLAGKHSVQLTLEDGKTLADKDILQHFAEIAEKSTGSQRGVAVCVLKRFARNDLLRTNVDWRMDREKWKFCIHRLSVPARPV